MDKGTKKEIEKGIKNVIKSIKKSPASVILIVLCTLSFCVFVYSVNFNRHARSTGGMIGESAGFLTGRAMGSIDGLTRGQIEGYEAGKEEGLNAKDTTVELSEKIQEVSKLEVLIASGTFSDVVTLGENPIQYAALLSQKYNAVFTVDLDTADIELKDDGLYILLDQPIVEFIPVGEIEKRNEYQKSSFVVKTGSAEDGYTAADNSMSQMRSKAKEKLQQDESLMKSARNSAITQLTQLVNAVSLTKPAVIVEFRGGVANE